MVNALFDKYFKFFLAGIFQRCGIEKWPKTGPLSCLSWIKMCWWFFGGLLGCCSKCCPYSMTCVGQASLVHNHNQQDILVCNSYPWEPRYDVHFLQWHPFHYCHLSHCSLILECGVDKDAVKELFQREIFVLFWTVLIYSDNILFFVSLLFIL